MVSGVHCVTLKLNVGSQWDGNDAGRQTVVKTQTLHSENESEPKAVFIFWNTSGPKFIIVLFRCHDDYFVKVSLTLVESDKRSSA